MEKEKRTIYDIMMGGGLFVITLCIIIFLTLVIISRYSPADLCSSYCDEKHGRYWIASDCDANDIRACSGFCEIGNQTLFCEDILKNITSLEG